MADGAGRIQAAATDSIIDMCDIEGAVEWGRQPARIVSAAVVEEIVRWLVEKDDDPTTPCLDWRRIAQEIHLEFS